MFRMLAVVCLAPLAHAAIDFAKDVAPLLEKRCQMCHGAQQQMSGLRLDNAAAAAKVITVGNSAQSKLIERVRSTKAGHRMPPVGQPLTTSEVAALAAWIDSGAKWPVDYRGGGGNSHWAFQPLARKSPPITQRNNWARNPIDSFILARLEAEGLTPSPEAEKRVLLRRVTFDLTGLPPTPDQIHEFLNDKRPDAYERLVDRLLASNHYGERWARPWLDLAHYADSDGYEKDRGRPYAWRYRNYVIDALNKDLPFDQFTIEQLAGDLLPNATPEQRAATGFARNTLTNREAGVDRGEARFEQLLNRVNTVSTTWMGLTVGCAQCHDHKYDPIRHREFYQMMAFFDAADDFEVEAPLPGEREKWDAALPDYLAKRDQILEKHKILELQRKWEARMRQAIANPGEDPEWDFWVTSMSAMFDHTRRVLHTDPAARQWRDEHRLTEYFLGTSIPEYNRIAEVKDRMKAAREEIEKLKATLPPLTMAMAMGPNPEYHGSHMRVKGDWKTLGEPVEAGGLSILPHMLGDPGRRTRLHLAQWLVAPDNPLTPRVTVNRAWQELFGRGIVRTSEDFGTQGDKPSHPELLDWLAARFIDDNWSMKKLHRLIVTSAAYRQASNARPDAAVKDPENALLARQNRLRLSAELVRDTALAAGGMLDLRIGGPSVKPPQPAGVAELGYGGQKWVESKGADRYRRGLYVHFQRTTPYPQLMNFDAPDSNVACSRRRSSNTALQSLNLLNDPVFFDAAKGLAARTATGPLPDRLNNAFLLAIGRTPDATERERLARYYDEQLGILSSDEASAAWALVCRVLLNLDEFITRE
ncbi:MAG: PSD1 domain-containing protein [Acidobacteria bacterium]|nr:PSD1 domain-containing protein [Acidobacteriota bacterium]